MINMDYKIYWLLTKFIVPLGLTTFVTDVAEQVLNRGLSSAENATEMLATFGIAYALTKFAAGPFEEFKNVALVLVHNKKEAKIGLITLFLLWAVVLMFALLIAYTDFGYFITHTLYSLDEKVGKAIRQTVLMLSFFPLFQGMIWYLSGYILQMKHTTLVGTASVMDVAVQDTNLSIPRVLMFWWPLAMVRGVQTVSRPIINLFVARDLQGSDEAIQAIAILSLVFPIGVCAFNWLNDLKALEPTFLKTTENTLVQRRHIRNFDICCVTLGFLISFSLFWIPGIVTSFYTSRFDLSEEVARMCVVPLKIFSVFPLLVGWRSHNTSWLLLLKKTTAVFPSGVIRLIVLITVLNIYPKLGLHGATLGIAALLSGFSSETLSVQIASCIVKYKMKRNRPVIASEDKNGNIRSSNDRPETTSFLNGDAVCQEEEIGEREELIVMQKLTSL